MKKIVKTVSFIAIMSAMPGAFAATSRASLMGQATSRLPSIAGYVNPVIASSGVLVGSSSGSLTASSLLSNADCIESYTDCIKANDICGANFEECTTNVLFHAQMPKCLSVLSQCSASGISNLFGTSSISALSNVAEKNSYDEVTRYTYPTDGSVLGQLITGAAIANRYDTQQCVKRYTSCLKKDSVCGNDFELCTSATEFKKQAVLCSSTLARCQSDGVIELYGSANTSVPPKSDSRLGMMINEGAELAAVNAVSTCYKVADQCILNACGSNPAKCMADTSAAVAAMTDAINNGVTVSAEQLAEMSGVISSGDVNKYIRNMCQETIGGNKYCYATSNEGRMPTASQLTDEDNREMVFEDIYAVRMNSAMKQRLQTILEKFDEKTKNQCIETMKTCAMRSCGSGVGSVCYSLVFKNGGASKGSINGKNTYDDIRLGCEAVTNTDPSCQYAVASANNNMYTYSYTDNNAFTTLFPEYGTDSDPIGIIATLNASLASSYNDAAIAQMKKQCSNTAVSCVKTMCGKDYSYCFRNRTDVMGTTYDTGSTAFDKSMNKQGGVLDYSVVTGLCINTVKSSKVCDEHLKIEAIKLGKNQKSSTWGSDSVRSDWLDASSSISVTESTSDVTIGCRTASDGCSETAVEACDYIDEDGCLYDVPVTQAWTDYVIDQSAKTLFQEILADIEKEAQAKRNAEITKQQNICLANNQGGAKGPKDLGSTFDWVKFKSGRVPKNYGATKGFTENQVVGSNDIYGSFCRVKVTLVSDTKEIQDVLDNSTSAYFAVGDPISCGAWLDQKVIDKIVKNVRDKAGEGKGVNSWKGKMAMAWATVGGFALGGTAGGLISSYLNKKNFGSDMGGLLSNRDAKSKINSKTNAGSCVNQIDKCINTGKVQYCRSALGDARAAGLENKGEYSTVQSLDLVDNASTKDCETKWVSDEMTFDNSGNAVPKTGSRAHKELVCSQTKEYSCDEKPNQIRCHESDLINLQNLCQSTAQENIKEDTKANVWGGAAIGAVVGTALGAGITATALQAEKYKAQDKAEQEFLETLGEHISCYVGGTEVAGFMVPFSVNFEDMQ